MSAKEKAPLSSLESSLYYYFILSND
jgi:hypothetical protein